MVGRAERPNPAGSLRVAQRAPPDHPLFVGTAIPIIGSTCTPCTPTTEERPAGRARHAPRPGSFGTEEGGALSARETGSASRELWPIRKEGDSPPFSCLTRCTGGERLRAHLGRRLWARREDASRSRGGRHGGRGRFSRVGAGRRCSIPEA